MRWAIVLGLVIALAGCGSNSDPKAHRAAVDYCTFGDANGGGTGDRSSCECAVDNAEKQGYSDKKLVAEMKDMTVISDKKLITISFLCAGR